MFTSFPSSGHIIRLLEGKYIIHVCIHAYSTRSKWHYYTSLFGSSPNKRDEPSSVSFTWGLKFPQVAWLRTHWPKLGWRNIPFQDSDIDVWWNLDANCAAKEVVAFKFLSLLQVASLIVHTYFAIGGTAISGMGRCSAWNCSEMSKGFPGLCVDKSLSDRNTFLKTTSSFFLAQLAARTHLNRGKMKTSGNSQW